MKECKQVGHGATGSFEARGLVQELNLLAQLLRDGLFYVPGAVSGHDGDGASGEYEKWSRDQGETLKYNRLLHEPLPTALQQYFIFQGRGSHATTTVQRFE